MIRRTYLKMTHLLVVCDGFALTASMAWIFGKLLGLNGIWYGVILGQAATVLVLSLYVWKKARKVTLSAEAYSCLDNGFGADPGDILPSRTVPAQQRPRKRCESFIWKKAFAPGKPCW